jgi:signal transduction histidine kinase
MQIVNTFQRDTGITATLSINGTVAEPAPSAQDVLPIVREALHNIHKHSGASQVMLSASQQGQMLQIDVEDNGSGFPFSGTLGLDELERQRLGPISIRRRVRLLNGHLIIASQPGQGAKLEIRIPA